MPEIKIQHVVSYSSQDTNNPADNLLKPDGVHKWRSAKTGEKQMSVILQFEKASKIHSIDLGNDGSAFVEVLVGKSSLDQEDFKVILVTSSFMTPSDSRSGNNRCSVRMFGAEKLCKPVSDEKWDRVKIVCTQPFNKNSIYGLSFVKFHSPPSSENQATAVTAQSEDDLTNPTKIGAFFFRQDDNDLKVGSLFARQKDKPDSPPLSGAAAVRAASNQARSDYLEKKACVSSGTSENSPTMNDGKNKRKHDLSDDEDGTEEKKARPAHSEEERHSKHREEEKSSHQREEKSSHQREEKSSHHREEKSSHHREEKSSHHREKSSHHREEKSSHHREEDRKARHHRDEERKEKKSSHKEDGKHRSSSSSNHSNSNSKNHTVSASESKAPPKNEVSKSAKEFSKIMEGVVFVLSGFQNPFRAELRDKAKEMGAKYRPDWIDDCTHLVCAFSNTPKYMQVKGRGKIVTKHWVMDCYRQKTLLHWRKYQLKERESEDDEKEEKEEEEEKKDRPLPERQKLSEIKDDPEYLPSKEDDASSEEEESEDDTDDEVRRIKENQKKHALRTVSSETGPSTSSAVPSTSSAVPSTSSAVPSTSIAVPSTSSAGEHSRSLESRSGDEHDAFGIATDEDDDGSDSDSELPVLPDFLSKKIFFLYGTFSETERHKLTRYIVAYNGELENYMSEKVDYVITAESWDDNFDDALSNYPQLTFVHPRWIDSCRQKNKWVPYQPHIVTP